ncbi:hypothetical protein EUGRSUZ_B01696 [Eucalyptus grandis]|uniref:F-box domain-containing protein n=2 Tax=Eucalyptus grandis TaxID=71139 RepID=A0A059D2C1_EUCGR|nr:hypothetical protein EUGRSUZ_B01696 [Eucalyptus grandis]
MDELPPAILSDILSRVPGKSLVQHRRVCRRWREAIDDPYFRSCLHRIRERLVLYREHGREEVQVLKMQQGGAAAAATRMTQIDKLSGPRGYVMRGTCNGLLFFMHRADVEHNSEVVINPLTKKILRLRRAPDLSPEMSVYGLGFDRSTNAYKMVQIDAIYSNEKTRTSTVVGARIYDFDKQSWRACKAPPLPPGAGLSPDFVFASGALKWLLERLTSSSDGPLARTMLSFDLTKEEFRLIPILTPIQDVYHGFRRRRSRRRRRHGGRDFPMRTQMDGRRGSWTDRGICWWETLSLVSLKAT